MKQVLLLVTLCACAAPAFAANEFTPRSENRLLRQESRVEAREFRQAPPDGLVATSPMAGAPAPKWAGTVGLAYTDGEDGSKTWNAPYFLQRALGEKDAFRIFGDGWTHVDPGAGGEDKSGIADVGIAYVRQLAGSKSGPKWSVGGDVGFMLPTGGDVGSSNGKVRLGASAKREFGRWTGSLGGRLIRLNGAVADHTSRYARAGLAGLDYDLGGDRTASLQLSRSYRPGAGGSTQASAAYEWPFGALKRELTGALSFTRGVTSGSRDNAIQFDLGFKF